jgi:hypothetical protein
MNIQNTSFPVQRHTTVRRMFAVMALNLTTANIKVISHSDPNQPTSTSTSNVPLTARSV